MQISLGLEELKDINFWKAVCAELLASVLYIITVVACGLSPNPVSHLHIALTVAFTVAVLASSFWDISGGHFNPAVTLALFLRGQVSVVRLVFYCLAQCAGSAAASALLYQITPSEFRANLGALSLHENINSGFGFLIEAILTFQFIWVVIASTDPIKTNIGFQPPLAIGLSVGIGLLAGIPYTGAALNPIRAFGPALIMNQRDDQWVYWFGPLVGAALASLSYKYVFRITPIIIPETEKEKEISMLKTQSV